MEEQILHISLSTDRTRLCIATTRGFKLYSTQPFELLQSEDTGCYRTIEIYDTSPLLALVGSGHQPAYSTRRLIIWNIPEKTAICETCVPDTILAVKMNKLKIVVILADSLHIYDTNTMTKHETITTSDNPKGLGCLSPSHSDCFLLYPGSNTRGHVSVYACFTDTKLTEIPAHNSALAALEINFTGKMCATASERGTVIRIWGLPGGGKLYTFKRGIMNVATYYLSFSLNSELLLSCSDSGTVHIYNLNREFVEEVSWRGKVRDSLLSFANYIAPTAYRDSFERSRSLITGRTHFSCKFIAEFLPNSGFLLAVSYKGEYILYTLDIEAGGEATVVQEGSIYN